MSKRKFVLKLATGLLLLGGIGTSAQTPPAPTPDSGGFSTRPLVPAAGEVTRLFLEGAFQFSNAAIALQQQEVVPELITIDLTTEWTGGTEGPGDEISRAWQVEVDLGDLPAESYDLLVRVNGEVFLFTYFRVEAQRPEPAPLPSPAPNVTPRRPLGINLAFVKDFSQMLNFVDVFKVSRPWISHRPSDETWDTGESFDVDELGWVRSLQPDQEAGTLMLGWLGNAYPGGRYTVLYEGEGELYFDWDARIIDGEPGRLVLYVTPEIGIHLVIRQTNPDNYIRNIRVVLPGFEDSYLEQPFHSTYVEFLRQFSVLRFMDWAETNAPPPGEWERRITPQHATQGSTDGVALEHIIAMANAVGRDAWFTVPHLATDEYVENMAALIRDQLDPELKAYIEYSNEVFNADYEQHAYAVEQGLELGLTAGDTEAIQQFQFFGEAAEGFKAALRFSSQRAVEIFAIFEQVFGSRQGLVRVLGGWQPDGLDLAQAVAGQILDWQEASKHADVYAVAPYFGWYLGQPDYAEQVEAMSVDEVLDAATAEMRTMLEVGAGLQEFVEARGLDLITYEAGQHMVEPGATPFNIGPVDEKLIAANRSQRMYDIYSEYINGWYEFSGLMSLFNDIQVFRSWGLLERWDQDIATAPKYRAVHDFLLSAPALQGDFNGDEAVDFTDFFIFVDAFGGTDSRFDLNGNGAVDFLDFFIFADAFGQRH